MKWDRYLPRRIITVTSVDTDEALRTMPSPCESSLLVMYLPVFPALYYPPFHDLPRMDWPPSTTYTGDLVHLAFPANANPLKVIPSSCHFSLCLVHEVTLSHAFSRAQTCLIFVLLPSSPSPTPSLQPGLVGVGHSPYLRCLPGHLTPSSPDAKQRPHSPLGSKCH